MKLTYPAVFHRDGASYWVEFPDLPGCQSFGDTQEEALENAQEALEGYCITLVEQGQQLAAPSDVFSVHPEEGTFACLVCADITAYLRQGRAVKKTLTIPAWLNKVAEERNVNFSQTLQNALFKELQIKS